MRESSTPSYILTLSLDIEKYQEDIISKEFDKYRKVYNCCLSELHKRYNHMRESKAYRQNCKAKKGKERNKMFSRLNIDFGLAEYSLHNFIKPMNKYYNLNSFIIQKIASRCFSAFQKLMFHEAEKVNFIKYNKLYSIEGKSNTTGIIYRDGCINFKNLSIPVIIKNNDLYAQRAVQDKVKFCRILKKETKGKTKWYVQLVLQGIPPQKINKNTGEIKSQIGFGDVGIDIGTRTIGISSKYDVKLLELAPSITDISKKLRLIQRKMDRSKIKTNPSKYNSNGTIKKGNKEKWNFSNHYVKLRNLRKELYRKQSEIRKQDHYKMINNLLNLGNKFYVETMSFKGLQKRSKKTEKNDKGKFKSKKRFGKSLGSKAPSMFLSMLDTKLKYNDEKLYKIDTRKVKASQFNHVTGEYTKKELKDRWNKNLGIQRDLYSAFLLMNVKENLKEIDREKCFETYDKFKTLHDKEIERLKLLKLNGNKLISSMGV